MNPHLKDNGRAATKIDFDALFELGPVLLQSIDADARILNVSAAWARLLGYTREEMTGRRVVEFMTPETRAFALTCGLPLLYSHGHVSNLSYVFTRADGRPLPVRLSAGAIYDEDGRFLRSLTVITDDRRAHYAERELDLRQRDTARDTAELTRRIERIGHEIRTPLNAILGFAALMEHGPLDSAQDARLREILQAARELRDRVDLLTREHPAAPAAPPPEGAPGEAPGGLPLTPMRVLLAENEARHQDALREMLRAGGHEVVTVANGYEAIEALFAGPVDLALIGLEMPGMGGAATVSQIRNSGRAFRNIPVIACAETGPGTAEGRARLRSLGMDGLIVKPATRNMLEGEIRRVLETRAPANT